MIELNLNTMIIADLTEVGEKILRKYYEKLAKKNTKIDVDVHVEHHLEFANKYKFSLWEFAAIFGDSMYNGGPNVVDENTIAINEDDLDYKPNEINDDEIQIRTKRQSITFSISSIEIDTSGKDVIQIERDDDGTHVITSKNMLKPYL